MNPEVLGQLGMRTGLILGNVWMAITQVILMQSSTLELFCLGLELFDSVSMNRAKQIQIKILLETVWFCLEK